MKNKSFLILVLAMLFISIPLINGQTVDVTIPDSTAQSGETISMPLRVSNLDGLGVISYLITISFDPQVLDATGIIISGSLTESWGAPTISDQEGQITIAGAGTTDLAGSGVLVYIEFGVVGSAGDQTNLSFAECVFNEGEPAANTFDGNFTVANSGVVVIISVPDTSEPQGATITIPVRVSDVTGLKVISYIFTLNFDQRILNATGVTVAGSLSEAWGEPIFSDTVGRITVAAAGATALDESGDLIHIMFDVVGEAWQQTELSFTNVMFNEGEPMASAENGTFTVAENIQSLNIFTRDTTAVTDTSIAIPICVDETSGLDIVSYIFTLTYNPQVLDVTGVTTENSLTNAWGIPTVADQSGQVVVAGAGTSALDGLGALVFVNFDVIGAAGQQSALTLSNVMFNEGNPMANIVSGSLTITPRTNVKQFNDKNFVPRDYILYQSYPNPFNSETLIKFSVPEPTRIKLYLFNTLGQRVKTIVETNLPIGNYQTIWDGKEDSGNVVASGEYFLIMKCDRFTKSRKILFLK